MPRTDFDEDYFCTRKIFSPQDALFRRLFNVYSVICFETYYFKHLLYVVISFCYVRLTCHLLCFTAVTKFSSPSFTYHTAVYRDRNLGLIIAIGLASITGFVRKKVCREKRFRLGRTRRLLWTCRYLLFIRFF